MGVVAPRDGNRNVQAAPYPQELAELVEKLEYRPGWRLGLGYADRGQSDRGGEKEGGLTFTVRSLGFDSYHPDRGETYGVIHSFPVPAATYNRESWMRWLLDRLVDVETHEACEFFQVKDSGYADDRPFAPHHGPGWDPYAIFVHGSVEDQRTSFRGEKKEET